MRTKTLLVLGMAAALAGCTTTNPDGSTTQNRSGTGAIIGAVAGAVIGHNVGGGRGGAAVGAIVGAATGAAIGNAMDEQERAFKDQLAVQEASHQAEVERVREDVVRITLHGEVQFDYDKATIKPQLASSLDRVANVLNQHPNSRIVIVGHTDDRGSDDYNQRLSQQRAEAVAQYLSGRGIAHSRMETRGMGESAPKVPNDTEANRQLNRRVEIYVQGAER